MMHIKEQWMHFQGKVARNRLVRRDSMLHPSHLSWFSRNYGEFHQFDGNDVLCASQGIAPPVKKDGRILIMISGPSGAGKDEVRKRITKALPGQVHKLVTATSRPPREDEVDGREYFFYPGVEAFRRAVDQGEFLETSRQGDEKRGFRWYGMPKQSVVEGIHRLERILITHVEMSEGWPNVARFVRSLPNALDIEKLFILPVMRATQYFWDWLPNKRKLGDYKERGIRAGWELQHAPWAADILANNYVDRGEDGLDQMAQTIALYIQGEFTSS